MTVNPNGVPGVVTGIYRTSFESGLTTGLLAGDTVFSMLWQNANLKALIQHIRLGAQIVTPFTAGQEIGAKAFVARSFTVADSGGTAQTIANLTKISSANNSASLLTDLRGATTGALTPGTRTLDGAAILAVYGDQLLAAASAAFSPIVGEYQPQATRYPVILAQNEGVVFRNIIAHGAGGTVRFFWDVEWLEFLPKA